MLPTFRDPNNNEIRVVRVDGEPLWVAKDVAQALGYTWDGHRIQHVPQEWRGMVSVTTPSGEQTMTALTEQGLYFFLGRSDKPAALPFQKWIAGEVLPAIRKTGGYQLAPLSRREMLQQMLDAEIKIEQQTQQIQQLEHHADEMDVWVEEVAEPALAFVAEFEDVPADEAVGSKALSVALGYPHTQMLAAMRRLRIIYASGFIPQLPHQGKFVQRFNRPYVQRGQERRSVTYLFRLCHLPWLHRRVVQGLPR